MIIIKPDLVIKWANSNLVLHRVRERRRCVFLRVPAPSYIFIFLNFLFDCARQSLIVCMRERVWEKEREGERETVCQGKKCCRGKAQTHTFIYIYTEECLLRHWRLLSSSSWQKGRKYPQTFPPSILFLLLILYLALTLFSSLPSPFLYHLQRQLFPSKWGHVRKVCKWNHCSWIRMGHHIP